ncbi:MAG: hypothetical protein HRU15_04170 [Planctomycetes bacterium]|nr:hypothetical protein [Planctomycetota bacterium]
MDTAMWGNAWRRGLDAARKNIIPGIIIWIIASSVILLWYFYEPAHAIMQNIADVKTQAPYLFSFFSTAIAGALLPGIVLGIFKLHPRAWSQLSWLFLFYGLKGMEINALYHFQAFMFGEGNNWQTICKKSIFDQLIYVPIWGIASVTVSYSWIEGGMHELRTSFKDNWLANYWLPILLANFSVWIPVVILLYMLPTALQLPLQNLVLCFWSLLMAVIANRDNKNPDSLQ